MALAESTVFGSSNRARHARVGFTLLELMVTITVAAMVLTLGVPSFVDLVRNNRAATNVNELLTAFSIARSESIKRGANVSVCRSVGRRDLHRRLVRRLDRVSRRCCDRHGRSGRRRRLAHLARNAGQRNGYDFRQRRSYRHRVGPFRAPRRGSDGGRDAYSLRHRTRRLLAACRCAAWN